MSSKRISLTYPIASNLRNIQIHWIGINCLPTKQAT